MKDLENIVGVNDTNKLVTGDYVIKPNSSGYSGLKLVEKRPYAGGTSIKYWM